MDECPPEQLTEALALIQHDDEKGLERLEALLGDYPRDPRLHFLKGSVLAGVRRYDEGLQAMRTAVQIAPGYAIARFQLGFLELTSGQALAAEETWLPLEALPADNPLQLFARGLKHLARDEFERAEADLREGMRLNRELPQLNNDMQLILDNIAGLDKGPPGDDEPVSSAHMLLQQYAAKPTKH